MRPRLIINSSIPLMELLKSNRVVKLSGNLEEFIGLSLHNKLKQAGFQFYTNAYYEIRTDGMAEIFLQEKYFHRFNGNTTREVKLTNNEMQDLSRAYATYVASRIQDQQKTAVEPGQFNKPM